MSTFFAYNFLALFTGATFTEKIFGWHGMGEWFIDSINKNDVNSVVAVNIFAAVVVLLSGLPRRRAARRARPAGTALTVRSRTDR